MNLPSVQGLYEWMQTSILMNCMNTRSYSIYEEHFCILYTDFRCWTISLIESTPLGAENDNVSQCGLKCGKNSGEKPFLTMSDNTVFFDVNNIPFFALN